MTFYETQAGNPNNNLEDQTFEHSPSKRQTNDVAMLRNDGRARLLANEMLLREQEALHLSKNTVASYSLECALARSRPS